MLSATDNPTRLPNIQPDRLIFKLIPAEAAAEIIFHCISTALPT